MVRTATHLVLIENKVDPGYKDAEQVRDEINGGLALAASEGREFVFVLIAPGLISGHRSARSEAKEDWEEAA